MPQMAPLWWLALLALATALLKSASTLAYFNHTAGGPDEAGKKITPMPWKW